MGVHQVMRHIASTVVWFGAGDDLSAVTVAKLVKAGVLVPRRNKLDRRWRLAKGWRYSGALRRLSVRGVLCENVRGSNLWRLAPGVTLEHARNVACVLFTEVHG